MSSNFFQVATSTVFLQFSRNFAHVLCNVPIRTQLWNGFLKLFINFLASLIFLSNRYSCSFRLSRKLTHTIYVPTRRKLEQIFEILFLKFWRIFFKNFTSAAELLARPPLVTSFFVT